MNGEKEEFNLARVVMIDGLITCPLKNCKCKFCTNKDLQPHLESHWRETKSKNGWIMDAKNNPLLAAEISNVGSLVKGHYRYVLLARGKIIFRTKMDIKY